MPYKQSIKSELRKDEKRRLIFETAAKVFAEKGYHQTSVRDITEMAEISVGTFYLYFRNKEDLFEQLYDEMEQILDRIKEYACNKPVKAPAERFANAVTAAIWSYQKYRDLAKILLIEAVGLNQRFEEKYAAIMVKSCDSMEGTLRQLKEAGIIDVSDTKVTAIAHEGAFNHLITYWLRADDKIELKSYTKPLLIFLLQGLKMDFNLNELERRIDSMYEELEQAADELMQFK